MLTLYGLSKQEKVKTTFRVFFSFGFERQKSQVGATGEHQRLKQLNPHSTTPCLLRRLYLLSSAY